MRRPLAALFPLLTAAALAAAVGQPPAPSPAPLIPSPASAAVPDDWRAFQLAQAAEVVAGKATTYGNGAQRAVIAYGLTGDPKYAAAAYKAMFGAAPFPAKPWNPWLNWDGNTVRQVGWEQAYLYSLIRDTLTPDQREWAEFRLRRIALWCLHDPAASPPAGTTWWGGFRLTDGDASAGQYFALAHIDRALGTTYLAATARDVTGAKLCPVGGLTATAADDSTVRNHLRRVCESLAAGGEWDESTEYNLNTAKIVLCSALLLDGKDLPNFPELKKWAGEAAAFSPTLLTPDRKVLIRWGDSEQYNPADLKPHYLVPYLLAIHAASGDPRPLAVAKTLIDRNRWAPGTWAVQGGDWVYLLALKGLFDPAALAAAPPDQTPDGVYVSNSNVNGRHVRRVVGPAVFFAHFAGSPAEDHWPDYLSDFGWYDGSEYHGPVLGYALYPKAPGMARDALMYGQSGRLATRTVPEVVPTPNGVIVRGGTSGARWSGWNVPPAYAERQVEVEYTAPGTVRVKNTFKSALPAGFDPARFTWPDAAGKAAFLDALAGKRPLWDVGVLVLAKAAPVETKPGVWSYTTPGGKGRTVTAIGHASAAVAAAAPIPGCLTPENAANRYRIGLTSSAPAAAIEYTDGPVVVPTVVKTVTVTTVRTEVTYSDGTVTVSEATTTTEQ